MDDKVKVFNESGHGYWLEGFGCIRAGGGFNDANTGHAIVVLNDQGGSVMDVSYEKTATLRAQDHGHPPIICLEGNGSRPSHRGGGYSEEGKMFTINTIERHAVCYAIIKLKETKNPSNGIKETKVSCTLDQNGGAPNCEQGGC